VREDCAGEGVEWGRGGCGRDGKWRTEIWKGESGKGGIRRGPGDSGVCWNGKMSVNRDRVGQEGKREGN